MPARSSKAARCARCWRGRAIPTRWACATPSPICCPTRCELVPIGGSPPDLREPPAGLPLRAALPVRPARLQPRRPPIERQRRPSIGLPPRQRGRHSSNSRIGSQRHGSARRASRCREAFSGDALAGRDRPRARTRPCTRSTASTFDVGDGDAVGHRGRIGLRQDHLGPPDAEAGRADRRRDRLRRRADGRAGGRAAARLPPPGAARVPEPVRRAQPALHHLSRRRRAADQRRHRQGRARRPRRLGVPPRPPRRLRPLSSTAIRTS